MPRNQRRNQRLLIKLSNYYGWDTFLPSRFRRHLVKDTLRKIVVNAVHTASRII